MILRRMPVRLQVLFSSTLRSAVRRYSSLVPSLLPVPRSRGLWYGMLCTCGAVKYEYIFLFRSLHPSPGLPDNDTAYSFSTVRVPRTRIRSNRPFRSRYLRFGHPKATTSHADTGTAERGDWACSAGTVGTVDVQVRPTRKIQAAQVDKLPGILHHSFQPPPRPPSSVLRLAPHRKTPSRPNLSTDLPLPPSTTSQQISRNLQHANAS